jgi:drug/metabolite transporter (DMT)-like permease
LVKIEQIALIIYVSASTAGVLIIKNFFNTIHYENIYGFIYQLFNLNLIFGIFLYIFGFVTWLYVLSKMSLNIAYPVAVTLSFLAILVFSTLLLKEKFTINIGIGSLLCVIGIIFILK